MSPRSPTFIVGIDLGTTHTVVAYASTGASEATAQIFAIPGLLGPNEFRAAPLLPSCLYAPLPDEAFSDPWGDLPWAVGEVARKRGGEVFHRFISSSKSWLGHSGVDRSAPILPWTTDEAHEGPRISPIEVSTRILSHVRKTWNEAFPSEPLESQMLILTVPASFDEVARELTVTAAERAGLAVKLLEEPQAAFYDYIKNVGEAVLHDGSSGDSRLVLVCDVGGGTTDFSLLAIHSEIERVAVGHHLLLGGDNMDLALAHHCEKQWKEEGETLPSLRFGELVLACRTAKEILLSEDAPTETTIAVSKGGTRLVGNTLRANLQKTLVERLVVDGFFPGVSLTDRPERARSGFVAFGLPYERDAAITRHLAAFLSRHCPDRVPDALLFNGGVFRSPVIGERVRAVLTAWRGSDVTLLAGADPDLAVARGAVAYGLSLRGVGRRIRGGAAHAYYIGLASEGTARPRAMCVVPQGAPEGESQVAAGRALSLVVGRPVRFELFASEAKVNHRPGDVTELDDDLFSRLPPLFTKIAGSGGRREVEVHLEGELTAVGTLELRCVENAPPGTDRVNTVHRLAFQIRGGEPEAREGGRATETKSQPPLVGAKRIFEAQEAMAKAYAESADVRAVKNLMRDLERALGERSNWTLETSRAVFDALSSFAAQRKCSPDHERTYFWLMGFSLRPGFGHPTDAQRIAKIAPLFKQGLFFPDEPRSWQQFWIACRRVAAGLDERDQTSIRDAVDPFVAPADKKLKKSKRFKPPSIEDMLEAVSSLERVAPARRSELGGWILERTWTSRDPRLWSAIGRLGARVPTYASAHHVVSPAVAERWVDHLLREKWDEVKSASLAAVQLCRVTEDRARDVSAAVRRDVALRLEKHAAPEPWVRAVREFVPIQNEDRVAFYGEDLPQGLRLTERD